jgi:hypothetical protein
LRVPWVQVTAFSYGWKKYLASQPRTIQINFGKPQELLTEASTAIQPMGLQLVGCKLIGCGRSLHSGQ